MSVLGPSNFTWFDLHTVEREHPLVHAALQSLVRNLELFQAQTFEAVNAIILDSDVINANAIANTIASVTGLEFNVAAGGLYWFEFKIRYDAAAVTTGSRWSITGPAAPTRLVYRSDYSLTVASRTINDGLTAYDLPAASNATSPNTAGNLATIEGFIQPSVDGTVTARFASEVAASAITAKSGSMVSWRRVK